MIAACLSHEEPPTEPVLSEQMRQVYSDLLMAKQAMINDEDVQVRRLVEFTRGLPSRESLKSDEFQAELKAFEQMYTEFSALTTQQDLLEKYQAVVQWCISCHERHCPGPLRTIKKLQLD